MRVAAYVRVSTDEQADKGNSLVEQRERLEAYCKVMGWGSPIFFIDDGYSAKDMRRPAVQKLINQAQERKFDAVLTSKLDRMSRNLLDMLQLVKMLSNFDCNYVSASEQFDTSTATGRLVLQLLGTFAEFERERIRERVKDNMSSLARNTDRVLTRPCFGYDIIDGKYSINKDESPFVQLMFDLAEQGHGHRMIAKILNDRGSTTKRGMSWDQINVKRLMNNDTICGTMVYNMRESKNDKTILRNKEEWIVKENNHPAIITKEQAQKVKSIINSRKRAKKHADSETYLLTGLVKCGHCGKNMKGNTARVRRAGKSYDYFRYVCSSYTLGYGCKYHAVHRDDLETAIIEEIKRIEVASLKNLELNISTSAINIDEVEELNSQLIKIDKKIQKQIEAYENDLISASDLKAASNRAEKERTALNEALQKVKIRKASVKDVQENVSILIEDIMGADRVKSKGSIRQLIDKIDLHNGDLISVVWKPRV